MFCIYYYDDFFVVVISFIFFASECVEDYLLQKML